MNVSPLPHGTALSRYVRSLGMAGGNLMVAHEIAKQWVDTPTVALTLKSAVEAQSTPDLGEYGLDRELVEAIRGVSVLARLQPLMRAVPFRTAVSVEATPAAASWIAESGLKPVQAIAYGSNATLDEYKAGLIVVLSAELVKFSNPSADAAVRSTIAASVAAFLDGQFLDPTVTAVAGERPASVTNGAQTVVSSGATAADILGDLQDMVAELESWNAPRWIMKPSTAAHIAGSDATLFSGLRATPEGGTLLGIPVVTSTNCPDAVILMDAGDILIADDGRASVTPARHASVVMDDGQSPLSAIELNLWTSNLVGIRVERLVSWLRAHDESVVSMGVSY